MKALGAYLAVPYVRQAALLLIAACALLLFVQMEYRAPLIERHSEATVRFEQMRARAAELTARIDSIETYDDMQVQLANATERLKAGLDRSAVVERLTELSTSSGTRIIHGANSFGRERGNVIPVEQDLTVEGPYVALANFLTGLDTLETLTLLRSAEISANPDGSLVRAKLKLMTLSSEPEG